jgi:hypothetical protein
MISKRYLSESLLWIAAFVIVLQGVLWGAERLGPGTGVRSLLLIPVAVVLGIGLWVELRQIRRMDELHRLMYLIATLTGSMLAVTFCAIAYLGEVLVGWPRVAPIFVIAVLGGGFVIGSLGAYRYYR